MLTVSTSGRRDGPGSQETGIAFLLAQLGAFAAGRFGERAAEAGFSPPEAGLLRLISRTPGQSQQQIAAQLGTRPSRLVALVDGLERRGLVERRRSTQDRRNYALHLTGAGRDAMAVLAQAAAGHEAAITEPLSAAEREQLGGLLARLAAAHRLRPGVHPGYQHLPGPGEPPH